MKKRMAWVAFGALVLAGLALSAQEMKKSMITVDSGKEILITGELSCTSCKLANPEAPCSADCSKSCIQAGDPPLLTDKDGQQYILLSAQKMETMMTSDMMTLVGEKVAVKGMLVKGKGIQVIYVKEMKKA